MATLTEVSADIAHVIGDLPKAGANDKVWIIGETLWASRSETESGGVISAITGNTIAFTWEGANNSVTAGCTSEMVNNHDVFKQTLSIKVFDLSTANITQVRNLIQGGRLRVIVERKGGSDCGGVFWLFGHCSGLKAKLTEFELSDPETCAFTLTFDPPEEAIGETYPMHTIFDTDYATTKTMVEALETA